MKPLHRFVAALSLLSLPALAHATLFTYAASMAGINEVPPNASTATGFVVVVYDSTAHTLNVDLSYAGLIGGTPSAAHIHAPAAPGVNAGVAVGFPGFPIGLSGVYSHVFDLLDPTIYTAGFLNNFGGGTAAGAEVALANALAGGLAYSNIHNGIFPGGEIRGNLAATTAAVPDSTSALFLFAPTFLILLGLARRGG